MKQISFEEFKLIYKKNYEIIVNILLKHNVRFSCACGTMLGAIREKDIIEWDYDIDNFFFEEDLEQLLSVEKYLPNNFYIQSYKNGDLKYGLVRICCKNLFRHDKKSSKYINVFYDFFSLKNVSCPEQKRKKLFLKFIKEEKKAEYKVSTHKSANPFKELLKKIYKLLLPSFKNVSNKIQKKVSKLKHGNTCIMCKSFKIVSPLPINKEEIIFVQFSNFKIPCYEKHIIILETLYGKDWRTPKEFGERKIPEFYIQ
ncbi:LicD family protein [bacterium]|nr:LicD family protein [bacterium]